MNMEEAASIANLGQQSIARKVDELANERLDRMNDYPDTKGENMAEDVKREFYIYQCPVCEEVFPLNKHGFAITCDCVE